MSSKFSPSAYIAANASYFGDAALWRRLISDGDSCGTMAHCVTEILVGLRRLLHRRFRNTEGFAALGVSLLSDYKGEFKGDHQFKSAL